MSTLNTVPQVPAPAAQEAQKFRRQMGQISRHSAVFFAGTMFTAAAGYLFKVYLARVLGAEALGLYALGMTIIGFVGVFNGLGLPQAAVRFVAAYGATGRYAELRGFMLRAVGALLGANLVLGLLVVLAGPWIADHFYHAPPLKAYLGLFALIMMLGAFTTFFGQVLQGYKDVARRTLITSFVGTPLMMLLTIVLVVWGMGLRGYLVAQIVSAGSVLLLLLASAWARTPSEARSRSLAVPPWSREIVSFSSAVYGIDFMKFVLSQSDKVLIGMFLTARDVGVYAVAAAIVAYVPIVLQSVNQIFSPMIAELHGSGQRILLGRMFQVLTKWIVGLTIPLASVVIVFARPLMSMFGVGFERGWPILILGTVGQLVSCGVGSVGFLLLMSGNHQRLLRIQIAMSVFMLIMSLIFVPLWGIVGAALAAALTNAGTNAWNLNEVRSRLGLVPYTRDYFKLVAPTVATLGVVIASRWIFLDAHWQWIVIVATVLVAYFTFVAVLAGQGLGVDDRQVVDTFLGRRGFAAEVAEGETG
jgi:O-antigen/teichoic acid export membrane protein